MTTFISHSQACLPFLRKLQALEVEHQATQQALLHVKSSLRDQEERTSDFVQANDQLRADLHLAEEGKEQLNASVKHLQKVSAECREALQSKELELRKVFCLWGPSHRTSLTCALGAWWIHKWWQARE